MTVGIVWALTPICLLSVVLFEIYKLTLRGLARILSYITVECLEGPEFCSSWIESSAKRSLGYGFLLTVWFSSSSCCVQTALRGHFVVLVIQWSCLFMYFLFWLIRKNVLYEKIKFHANLFPALVKLNDMSWLWNNILSCFCPRQFGQFPLFMKENKFLVALLSVLVKHNYETVPCWSSSKLRCKVEHIVPIRTSSKSII